MKYTKTLLLMVLLLGLLGGCTPKPPAVTPPEEPPEEPPGLPLISRAEIRVGALQWSFDPDAIEVITMPGRGQAHFYVDGKLLRFDLAPGTEDLSFTVKDTDFTYEVRYLPSLVEPVLARIAPAAAPPLYLPAMGVMPVTQGESVLLTLLWPFDRDAVEAALRSGLGGHLLSLNWHREYELLLEVSGEVGDVVEMGLAELDPLPGFTLTVGKVHMPNYSLQFVSAAELRAINTLSGTETTWKLPYYVSDVVKWSGSVEEINGQRWYNLPGASEYSDDMMHEFSFSLRDGSVAEAPFLSPNDFPRLRQWLYDIVKLEWPEDAYSFSHVGISQQQDLVAAIFCGPEGNNMLIHNVRSGERQLHPLPSAADRGGSGIPATELLWSHDGKLIFYTPYDDGNPNTVCAFDLVTKQESLLLTADVDLIAVSDYAPEVLLKDEGLYYLLDIEGNLRHLPGLAGELLVVNWLSSTSFLCTDGNMSYIYDIRIDEITWTAEGKAVGYSYDSSTVWLFGY